MKITNEGELCRAGFRNIHNYKSLQTQLEFAEMTDHRFQTIFKEKFHLEFWCEVSKDYPSLDEVQLRLLQSASAYLSEKNFSAVVFIRTRQ
jgi:hypothetical protein